MTIRIVRRIDGVYDVYDGDSDKLLFCRASADNVLTQLGQMQSIAIDFVDEEFERWRTAVSKHKVPVAYGNQT